MIVAMTFLSPGWLLLLLAVAALAVAYVFLQTRRRHHAVRFTNLDLLASVAPRRPGWRRHVPAAVTALAMASLVVALARPVRNERVPKEAATIVLAVDTSASMQATDVSPTRLDAARDAGLKFVGDLPDRLRVGLVAPTTDHHAVEQGLRDLVTGAGTAAGDGIEAALASISASAPALPPGSDTTASTSQAAAIVLLSDGASTVGRPIDDAARDAADAHVPVTTIVFGTPDGTVEVRGRTVPVPPDEASMRRVAETTGGSSFEAASAGELRSVYDDIGSRVGYVTEQREIGMRFVAAGVVLLLAAVAAALVWSARFL